MVRYFILTCTSAGTCLAPFQSNGMECDLEYVRNVRRKTGRPSLMHPRSAAMLDPPQSLSWPNGKIDRPSHNDPEGKLNHQDVALVAGQTQEGN